MNMIDIAQPVSEASQHKIALGILQAQVKVTEHDVALWDEIETAIAVLTKQNIEQVTDLAEISALRNTYKNLGKSPSRYRGSNEALLRRIIQGKGLYQVNTIVDINNLLSITSKCSVGSYDVSQLQGQITLRAGQENESYKGIGKEAINIENLPVLSDEKGAFGSPTSDSERAMIMPTSTNLMMVIYGFDGDTKLDDQLKQAEQWLIKYAGAQEVTTNIIR